MEPVYEGATGASKSFMVVPRYNRSETETCCGTPIRILISATVCFLTFASGVALLAWLSSKKYNKAFFLMVKITSVLLIILLKEIIVMYYHAYHNTFFCIPDCDSSKSFCEGWAHAFGILGGGFLVIAAATFAGAICQMKTLEWSGSYSEWFNHWQLLYMCYIILYYSYHRTSTTSLESNCYMLSLHLPSIYRLFYDIWWSWSHLHISCAPDHLR